MTAYCSMDFIWQIIKTGICLHYYKQLLLFPGALKCSQSFTTITKQASTSEDNVRWRILIRQSSVCTLLSARRALIECGM